MFGNIVCCQTSVKIGAVMKPDAVGSSLSRRPLPDVIAERITDWGLADQPELQQFVTG